MVVFRIIKKFGLILSKHQKIRIIELFFLMLISGFMEMLSVALIVPFVQTVFNAETVMQNKYVILVMDIFNLQTYKTFLIFLSVLMGVIYFAKNAFLVAEYTIQERFVQNNQYALQQTLLCSFLKRPYEYFLTTNSGEIMRIVMSDTAAAFSSLTTLITLFSELVVSIVLTITAFALAPQIMLVMTALLLVAVVIIGRFSKKTVRKAGEDFQKASTVMYLTLLQVIEGIKEVKLSKKENFFEKRYEKNSKSIIRASYINRLASNLPRYLIETFVMCGLFITLAVIMYMDAELGTLVPVLSGVAMAAVRLMPAANRIATAVSTLNYSEPAVDKLISNMSYLNEDECSSNIENAVNNNREICIDGFNDSIVAKDVYYKYPTGSSNVLSNAFLEIKRGQFVGIVGPSGAGKTTTVDLILGLLRPQSGEVLIDEKEICKDMDGWLSQIGYIPQSIFMLMGDIRSNVAFGVEEEDIDDDKVWKALRDASLEEFVKSLPDGIYTDIGERGVRVSGGQKQRIGIARALYRDPDILFFDEATSALDNETEAAIIDSIDHLHGSKTMIIIAHRLTTIEHCDVVYRVEDGKITKER